MRRGDHPVPPPCAGSGCCDASHDWPAAGRGRARRRRNRRAPGGQASSGADADRVGAVEAVHGDAGGLDRRHQPVAVRVDQCHLDVDAVVVQTGGEVGDHPFDAAEVEALGDEQDPHRSALTGRSPGGPAVLHPGDEVAEFAFQPEAAGGFGDEEVVAVAALDRGAPQPVEVGRAGFVHPAAGEGGGGEAAAHLGFGGVGAGQRLGVGEVGGGDADLGRRSVRSTGRVRRRSRRGRPGRAGRGCGCASRW